VYRPDYFGINVEFVWVFIQVRFFEKVKGSVVDMGRRGEVMRMNIREKRLFFPI